MQLGGLLRGVLEQAEDAYGRSLKKTTDQVSGVEKDAFLQLNMTLKQVERLKNGTAADVAQLIQQTQFAANHLLSQIPLVKRHPVLQGVRTRDILAEFDQSPKDIEVRGFWLVDPQLKLPPVVTIDKTPIDPKFVSAYADHLEITVPDPIKGKLAFSNSPCDPRKTFQVGLTIYYPQQRGIWPFRRTVASEWTQSVNVLPGMIQYQVQVQMSGQRKTETDVPRPFRVESPNFNWSCEQNASNLAVFSLPPNSRFNNDIQAGWADLGGGWENHGCSVATTGTTTTGSCWVRGGNRDCFLGACNCPGGGHGRVAVWGSVTTHQVDTADFRDELVYQTTMLSDSEVFATLPAATNTIVKKLNVQIQRTNSTAMCPNLYDEISVDLPINSDGAQSAQGVTATSKDGQFEVSANRAQVSVRKKPLTIP
jgi:hypothetical protein